MENKVNTNKVKTIVIMVLSVMLTLTLAFNIFILTIFEIKDVKSFKQVLLCRELVDSMNPLDQSPTEDTDSLPDTSIKIPEDTSATNDIPTEAKVVYNANNIKITYIKQEEGLLGPSLKFYIENNTFVTSHQLANVENNSDHAVDINFTNVFINDWLSDMSGGYCSELASGKRAYASLTLWESDYSEFTDKPEKIEFTINIVNYTDSGTWSSIEESDPICIILN